VETNLLAKLQFIPNSRLVLLVNSFEMLIIDIQAQSLGLEQFIYELKFNVYIIFKIFDIGIGKYYAVTCQY
jgi:hypothetical protein